MPRLDATDTAVATLSPVIITTCTPSAASMRRASGVDCLIGSASPSKPARRPSRATYITVCPSSRSAAPRSASADVPMPRSVINASLPTATARPPTLPVIPLPVWEAKLSDAGTECPFSIAPATIAAASGCSLDFSKAAASARKLSASPPEFAPMASGPSTASTETSFGRPSVSVPVLSTTNVSMFSRISRTSAFLVNTPALAPRPMPTMIDIGVANPSAQGQAMINTATALTKA